MKVLMVDQFLPNSVYVVELCRELRKYAKITIFCKKNAGTDLDGVIWKDKLYAGGKGKMAAVWEYGKGLFRLQKEIKKGSYDVVHVQSFKDAKYEIPLYCKNKKYIPRLVHTVHNLLPHEASAGDRELYSRFYNCCDLLVVHNEYCRQLLMKEYQIPEEKICITPHGSYTQIRKEENTDFGLTDRKIRFLQFGILRPYKGVDILLKALAQIPAEKREKIQVIIAGAQHPKLDPTDYGAMIRDLGLEDTVDLIKKHIPDEELDALYRQADICLFPYRDIYGRCCMPGSCRWGPPAGWCIRSSGTGRCRSRRLMRSSAGGGIPCRASGWYVGRARLCHHVTTRTGWFALVDSSVPNGFDGHPSESAVPVARTATVPPCRCRADSCFSLCHACVP